jgi:hypothetical protein
MSAWLIGFFLGAIAGFALLEFGFVGLVWGLACLGVIAWKGPRLPASAGVLAGIGAVWTILFARVMVQCSIENATPGSGCEAGDIGEWVVAAGSLLLLGIAGTILAARRLRAR